MSSRLALVAALQIFARAASADPAVAPAFHPGVAWPAFGGIRETSRQIMERESRFVPTKRINTHAFLTEDFQNLPSNPNSPQVANWPPTSGGGPPTPKTPQLLGINFTGTTLSETLSFPPDPMGAVGPRQFIVACNGRIKSFNKTNGLADGAINANPENFFASVKTPPVNNNFTSDPRIRYDRLSGRWFITMIDVPGQTGSLPNRAMIAVSDSGVISPATVWTFFYFQTDSSKFGDYPTLGIDANALYIGINLFGSRGLRSSFGGTSAFVVRKSSILGSGPAVVTAFPNLVGKLQGHATGPFSPQGADNFDPGATEGYIIGVDSGLYGQLQLRRVSNPGGTPTISDDITITIPANGPTINVPHLGNTGGVNGYLDGGDYRLLGAHFRNGHLWTTANIAVNNTGTPGSTRMGVRWYDLVGIASGQTPSVHQSSTVFQSSASDTADQRSYWMGTLMVSGQGHAAMGFSVAGANEFVNAGTVGRLANDPLATMRSPLLYTASGSAYNPPDDPGTASGRRWGDYSYTSLDPADDMTMWTIQQFCNAPNSYAVQVVKLLAPPPAIPASCSPPALSNGLSGITVALVGSSDGDSGFFDPGAGFSNRISAAINGGGVTVNSINYADPTHLTLNISISAAAVPGARTITVINPDGQSATSASGLLTILGAPTNRPPSLSAISARVMDELTPLTITNSATDPDGNSLTFSLDPGKPNGAIIQSNTGVFTWTPSEAQGPATYSITVRVTDNGSPPLSDTKTFSVTVNESNSPPVLAPLANHTNHVGSTLVVNSVVTDPDFPANTLSFDLGPKPPTGAILDSATGVITWSPTEAFANTNVTFTVKVTDNGVPPLSDTKSFDVFVVPKPVLQIKPETNEAVTLLWSAIAGQTYLLQYKSNLNEAAWNDLLPPVTATGSEASKQDSSAGAQRYYRVGLAP